ncbi:beta-lactamase family protein [Candidatus Gracilibacteria bacterium]|nr:beta-lactamase family protein [Candidatus Gracilibacteria bacterium]NJP19435.1 beta-lactamase family protein [Hydrococcus sp. CRU_1_1]
MQLFWQTVKIAIATLAILGIADNAKAATLNNNPLSDDLTQQLQSILARNVRESGTPGATVSIITPEGTWTGASGFSNLAEGIPMQPDDQFNIASVTKTFTAATVLKLVDEGRLSLEDNISQWLSPEVIGYIPDGDKMTIRQLLNHTSGIRNYTDGTAFQCDPADLANCDYLREWQSEELIALIDGKPPGAPLGTFSYSNTNYVLLGEIAEAATQSTYAEVLHSRLLAPLGLDDTFYPPQEMVPSGFVPGYFDLNGDGDLDDPLEDRFGSVKLLTTSGGLVSNAEDVSTFIDALFTGKVLKPKTLEEMLNFVNVGGFSDPLGRVGYGLGVWKAQTSFGTAWVHDGANPGYESQYVYFPDLNITATVLTNERRDFNRDGSLAEVDWQILSESVEIVLQDRQSVPEPGMVVGAIAISAGMLLRRKRPTS